MPLQARTSESLDEPPAAVEPPIAIDRPIAVDPPEALQSPAAPEPALAVEPVLDAPPEPEGEHAGFRRATLFSPAPQPSDNHEHIAPPALLSPVPVRRDQKPVGVTEKTPLPRPPIDFSKPLEGGNAAGDRPAAELPKSFQDEEDDDWYLRTGQPAPRREYLGEDVDVAPAAPPKKEGPQPWMLVLVGLGGLFLVAVFLILIAVVL